MFRRRRHRRDRAPDFVVVVAVVVGHPKIVGAGGRLGRAESVRPVASANKKRKTQ